MSACLRLSTSPKRVKIMVFSSADGNRNGALNTRNHRLVSRMSISVLIVAVHGSSTAEQDGHCSESAVFWAARDIREPFPVAMTGQHTTSNEPAGSVYLR